MKAKLVGSTRRYRYEFFEESIGEARDPNMKTLIIGSCVSRDQFTILQRLGDYELLDYIARQSLPSSCFPVDPTLIDKELFSSNFQLRSITGDFEGDLWRRVDATVDDADLILLDLIDERRGCLVLEGGGLITDSWELTATGQRESLPYQRHIALDSPEYFSLWAEAFDRLIDLLKERGKLQNLIVVAPSFASVYEDGTSDRNLAEVSRLNRAYEPYWHYLLQQGINIAAPNPALLRAARNHRWGPRPFHYSTDSELALNTTIRQQLNRLFLSRTDFELFQFSYQKARHTLESVHSTGDETHGVVAAEGLRTEYFVGGAKCSPAEPMRLTVFFNGAIERERSGGKVVFQRRTWMKDIHGVSAYIADPTLSAENDLGIGWGLGNKSSWGIPMQAGVVQAIIDDWRFRNRLHPSDGEVQFFGSSAGGFQALAVSALVPVNRVIVNNPQVDWLKYEARRFVLAAVNHVFGPEANTSSFRHIWGKRISVPTLMQRSLFLPNVMYLLNVCSQADFNIQFPLLREYYVQLPGDAATNNFVVHYYKSPETGHAPLPKEELLPYINSTCP